MFVYLLIAAELVLLWIVFWYLYVRDPKHRDVIRPQLWGGYDGSQWGNYAHPRTPVESYQQYQQSCMQELDYAHVEELVWDAQGRQYVPVAQQEAQNFLNNMAKQLDRQFSELNVKP